MGFSEQDFLVGITPDFFVEVKGHFEAEVDEIFSKAGIRWEAMPPQPNGIVTPEATDRYDAILALGVRFTADSVAGVKRPALISRWGVGYDNMDTAALTANHIALSITPGSVRRPVAEAILAYIFTLSTNLVMQDKLVRSGQWREDLPVLGRNIKGRVLGSLGCGNIAQELFRMVQSLGFGRLIACDPYVDPKQIEGLNIELVSQEELFRQSDYLCVNTFLNASTKGLVDEHHLRLMKPTAYVINTARGPIIDQKSIIKALNERWIAGAGLDVFEVEPLPADDPIRNCPNTVFSPHGLPWTEEITHGNSVESCNNIVTVSRGEIPQSIVNREVLNHPEFQAKVQKFKK